MLVVSDRVGVPQAAGTARGTTATSAGRTPRPSASSAPTPSAGPTRRGGCGPAPPAASCAVWSTTSWKARTAPPTTRAQWAVLPRPLRSAAPEAPGRRIGPAAEPRAPNGKQQKPEGSLPDPALFSGPPPHQGNGFSTSSGAPAELQRRTHLDLQPLEAHSSDFYFFREHPAGSC